MDFGNKREWKIIKKYKKRKKYHKRREKSNHKWIIKKWRKIFRKGLQKYSKTYNAFISLAPTHWIINNRKEISASHSFIIYSIQGKINYYLLQFSKAKMYSTTVMFESSRREIEDISKSTRNAIIKASARNRCKDGIQSRDSLNDVTSEHNELAPVSLPTSTQTIIDQTFRILRGLMRLESTSV